MEITDFIKSSVLLFVLLNPFLVIIYLIDILQKNDYVTFSKVLIYAALISLLVFCGFAFLGDAIFSDIVQAEFASFQIFGGIIFLIIGIKFVLRGPVAIEVLRGDSKHLAGAIAMPVLIGPGTISASVIIGKRLDVWLAFLAIFVSVSLSIAIIIGIKRLHDYVQPRNEILVQRYIEIIGRITALYIGTVSIEMIMQGFKIWFSKF